MDGKTRENLNKILQDIESLGVGTPEYHEATAFLLTIMAKRQWIIADSIRRSRAKSEERRKRKEEKNANKDREKEKEGATH